MAFMCIYLIRSGMRPRHDDPRTWYDRWIRVIGGVMILAFLILGLYLIIFR